MLHHYPLLHLNFTKSKHAKEMVPKARLRRPHGALAEGRYCKDPDAKPIDKRNSALNGKGLVLIIPTIIFLYGLFYVERMLWNFKQTAKAKINPLSRVPPLRDLSKVTSYKRPPKTTADYPGCLQFRCQKSDWCDTVAPTTYDGTEPPCCVHILRDMAREFDRVMWYLGLQYVPAYGMLLGLTRTGRFIPWTSDNDVLIESKTITKMTELWDTTKHLNHSLRFIMHEIPRICVEPDFANGQLQQWKLDEPVAVYNLKMPYVDIYKITIDERNNRVVDKSTNCIYKASDIFPIHRKQFYDGSFYQYFPNNAVAMLSHVYGRDWRVPDPAETPQGRTLCGKKATERLPSRINRLRLRKAVAEAASAIE